MLNTAALSSLNRVSTTLHSLYQMRMNKIHKFKAKVKIQSEIGPYILKTVTTVEELKAALRLRYEVFHREMIGKQQLHGIDVDEYDFHCDHLIIMERKTHRVVGTYRLNCTEFSKDFYSAREFNLQRLMLRPGIKTELGRACIHRDYRRGLVISLLWRGISEYMNATDSRTLFGCASVKTSSPREAALIYRYFFEAGRLFDGDSTTPTALYTMPQLGLWLHYYQGPLTVPEKQEVEALMPPLCRAYLKIGASIGGEPAWDSEFKCIDFLTILHREDLNKNLWKKYKLESGAPIE
jgi:putative hemolysin